MKQGASWRRKDTNDSFKKTLKMLFSSASVNGKNCFTKSFNFKLYNKETIIFWNLQ